jgi:hypothetical protein
VAVALEGDDLGAVDQPVGHGGAGDVFLVFDATRRGAVFVWGVLPVDVLRSVWSWAVTCPGPPAA